MGRELSQLSYKERTFSGLYSLLFSLIAGFSALLICLPFGLATAIIYGVSAFVFTTVILFLSSPVTEVRDGILKVGKASISTSLIGDVSTVSKDKVFLERGANLNANAYCKFVLGVPELVKIQIQDPKDPTPYWLISSNNPELLAKILRKL